MPELPEVEALRGFLEERTAGRTVEQVLPLSVNVLKTYTPAPEALQGRTVEQVRRYGKFLAVDTGGLYLVMHLARAGWLRWRSSFPDRPPRPGKGPSALRVRFAPEGDGFDLTEAGTRKNLAVYVVTEPAEVDGIARLGPDPLDAAFTPEVLADVLRGRRQRIKGVLRDQGIIAGIGNAYSDEILHAARMSPFRIAGDLGPEETAALYSAIGGTLTEALERARPLGAGELKAGKREGMRVHGRTGEACPVCGDTVHEVAFHDSSLQYCPTCQTGGRTLADRRRSRILK